MIYYNLECFTLNLMLISLLTLRIKHQSIKAKWDQVNHLMDMFLFIKYPELDQQQKNMMPISHHCVKLHTLLA